jgi:hypothetical protein
MTAIRMSETLLGYLFVELLGVVAQNVADLATDDLMLQRIGDGRLAEAGLVAAHQALAFEAIAMEAPIADHAGERIGQLYLSARARLLIGDQSDLGCRI